MRSYDFERHHKTVAESMSGFDGFVFGPSNLIPMLLRWGDVDSWTEYVDLAMANLRLVLSQPLEELATEQAAIMMGAFYWTLTLHTTGVMHGREQLLAFMAETGLTYRDAEATWDRNQIPWVRERGDTTMNAFWCGCSSGNTCASYSAWVHWTSAVEFQPEQE